MYWQCSWWRETWNILSSMCWLYVICCTWWKANNEECHSQHEGKMWIKQVALSSSLMFDETLFVCPTFSSDVCKAIVSECCKKLHNHHSWVLESFKVPASTQIISATRIDSLVLRIYTSILYWEVKYAIF